MIPGLLVLATQMLDGLGFVLAHDYGTESNPIMAAFVVPYGPLGVLVVKIMLGTVLGVVVVRTRRTASGSWWVVPCLIGCFGVTSELLAVLL